MHQIADLPHEGLMLVDDRLGVLMVVIEPRSRHRRLDIANRLFPLGNAALKIVDALLSRVLGLPNLPSLGFLSFPFLIRDGRRGGWSWRGLFDGLLCCLGGA